jgi:Autotransporter beta-domain
MKLVVAFSLLLTGINSSFAQGFGITAAYSYCYAPQFDKAIQAYNFSRPFQTEKQPLLINGFTTGLSYSFQTKSRFRSGIALNYSAFRSYSENADFNNSYHLSFLELGYTLTYHFSESKLKSSLEMNASCLTSSLKRKINDETFTFAEEKTRAFGIGGNLSLRYLYSFSVNANYNLSPFIGVNYSPYLFTPNTETVINQTKTLFTKPWTPVVRVDVGLKIDL